jgi:hypothetical protein
MVEIPECSLKGYRKNGRNSGVNESISNLHESHYAGYLVFAI